LISEFPTNEFSDSNPNEPVDRPPDDSVGPVHPGLPLSRADEPAAYDPLLAQNEPSIVEPPLFQSWQRPEIRPVVRIPNFGHLALLIPLLLLGVIAASVLFVGGVRIHLFGVASLQQAGNEIHFILGMEGLIYLFTFAAALLIFPVFWHKSLLAGLQWNGATALRLSPRLVTAAFVCFLLAWLNGVLMPGPTNTPIEKVFHTPGAAWILFGFGVTFAPFFEEMFFRGFLLPSLSTAYDWAAEQITGRRMGPLDANGHPQWSLTAMVVASIATSIPFAWMHAEQTGYSLGPFLLLVGVSLVLCAVRLLTRSLASSVFVHACYNFLLFSLMMVATGGFRHLDKM
jgi:membrane protease YdiL (CAAX protease family)